MFNSLPRPLCHTLAQEIVGSNTAKLVTFNLGYLPYGDKQVTTKTATTVAAVEAALEVSLCDSYVVLLHLIQRCNYGRDPSKAVRI